MSDFIPFHRELTRGDKRGLSRATRFIFLELALHARQTNGVMRLAVGVDVVDAVHDELGGSRREIAEAIAALSKPLRPDEPPMIRIDEHEAGARDLVIVAWETWKLRDTSAERARRYRAKKTGLPSEPVTSTERDGATSPSRDASRDASATSRDSVTAHHGTEERRGEEIPPTEGTRVTREPQPERFDPSHGFVHRAAEVYEQAVFDATGHTCSLDRLAREDLKAALKHMRADSADAGCEWLAAKVKHFVAASKHDPIAHGGFRPKNLNAWLNAGEPAVWGRATSSPYEPTHSAKKPPYLQPFKGHKA